MGRQEAQAGRPWEYATAVRRAARANDKCVRRRCRDVGADCGRDVLSIQLSLEPRRYHRNHAGHAFSAVPIHENVNPGGSPAKPFEPVARPCGRCGVRTWPKGNTSRPAGAARIVSPAGTGVGTTTVFDRVSLIEPPVWRAVTNVGKTVHQGTKSPASSRSHAASRRPISRRDRHGLSFGAKTATGLLEMLLLRRWRHF